MNKQISILGTGWLGLPLAKHLINKNYTIKGSTTSEIKLENLRYEGIHPYQITLTEEGPKGDINSFLADSDILIINIPPGLRKNPSVNFIAKIQHLIPHIERSYIKKVIFVSSTSVFADAEEYLLVNHQTAPNASSNAGKQLIATERLIKKNSFIDTTILRFAGLFDERRHPATMLSKRKDIKNPLAPVNLIHREDCIGIIDKIIKTNSWNEVFNASNPDHTPKAKYYSKICKQMGLPIPEYDYDTVSKGKIIDSSTLEEVLGYTFTYPL